MVVCTGGVSALAMKTARAGLARAGVSRASFCPRVELLEDHPSAAILTKIRFASVGVHYFPLYYGAGFEGPTLDSDGWTGVNAALDQALFFTRVDNDAQGKQSVKITAVDGYVVRTAIVHAGSLLIGEVRAYGNGTSSAIYLRDPDHNKWWFKASPSVAGSWLSVETAAGECILGGDWVDLLGGNDPGSGQPDILIAADQTRLEIKVVRTSAAQVNVDDARIGYYSDPVSREGFYRYRKVDRPEATFTQVVPADIRA